MGYSGSSAAIYPPQSRLPAEVELAREDFGTAASVLEVALAGRPYLVGDRFTVADIVTAYTLRWASWYDALAEHPGLAAYLEEHASRPAYPEELGG